MTNGNPPPSSPQGPDPKYAGGINTVGSNPPTSTGGTTTTSTNPNPHGECPYGYCDDGTIIRSTHPASNICAHAYYYIAACDSQRSSTTTEQPSAPSKPTTGTATTTTSTTPVTPSPTNDTFL